MRKTRLRREKAAEPRRLEPASAGTFPKLRSGGPCETPLKLEILPRTRSSAVGRAIPAAFCKLGPKIGETVRLGPRRGGPWRRSILRWVSAPNPGPKFVV